MNEIKTIILEEIIAHSQLYSNLLLQINEGDVMIIELTISKKTRS